jgi:hypothetical protein
MRALGLLRRSFSASIDDYGELVMIGMEKLKNVEKKSSSSNLPNKKPYMDCCKPSR